MLDRLLLFIQFKHRRTIWRRLLLWRARVVLYRAGVIKCPECRHARLGGVHKLSCDFKVRERDGRNWH